MQNTPLSRAGSGIAIALRNLLLALLFLPLCLLAGNPDAPARIVVTDNIVAPDPQPFGLNQLNGRWGLNNIAYTGPGNGYNSELVRDRWFVSDFGTTTDGRAWMEDGSFDGTNLGDGYYDGGLIRVYRPATQPDGVVTYERIATTSVQNSYIGRQFWSITFGINDSLNATANRPDGTQDTVSFRDVLPESSRSYADGRMHPFYQMTDLEDGHTYYYMVRAIDSGGNWSADSNVASATPGDASRSGPRIVTHQIGTINAGDSNKSFTIDVTNGVGDLTFSIVGSLPGALIGEEYVNAQREAYRIVLPSTATATATEAATQMIRLRVEDANGDFDERDIVLNPAAPNLNGSDETAPAPPQNVQATAMDGAVYVTWDASPDSDVIGYKVFRSRFAPADQLGRIEFADAVALQTGDLVFVEKEFSRIKGEPERYHERTYFKAFEGDPLWPQWQVDGQGSWLDWRNSYNNGYHADYDIAYEAHPTPVPAAFEHPGDRAVRVSVPANWNHRLMLFKLDYTQDAGDLFYRALEPGKTYNLSMWVRQENVPNGEIKIEVTSNTHSASLARTFNIPDGQWTQILINDWQIPTYDTSSAVDRVNIVINGGASPSTVWFDAVEAYEFNDANNDGINDTPPGELTQVWKDELVDFFETASPDSPRPAFRYWGLQSNGEGGVAFEDLLKPRIAQRESGGQGAGESLPAFLELCKEVNANPWLILSVSMPEEEWAAVLEYLAGDGTTTWGAQRIADRGGITTPWTEEFQRIFIESDNETWNSMFAWGFYGAPAGENGATAYGRFSEMLFRAMKNSPVWQADPVAMDAKIDFVANGFNSNNTYGYEAALSAPSAEIVDVAPYLGGWESGTYIGGDTLTDEGFQDWMLFAPWKHYNQVNGHVARLQEAAALRPTPYRLGVYEGGPGYDLPGPSNPSGIVPESYGKSLAAAITTLDSYLYESYRGYDAQAFFGFQVGTRWTTHAFQHNGTDQPLSFLPQATWLAQKLRNNFASGGMVETFSTSVPTIDLPAEAGQAAAPNTPLLATYSFKDGDRYSVLLMSRKLDDLTPVTLDLPFESAQTIELHRIVGDPRSTNVPGLPYFDPNNILQIESIPLSPADLIDGSFVVKPETGGVQNVDGTIVGMPAGCLYLYVFDGVQAAAKPAAPQVSITRAPGQTLSSFTTTATFRVSFDRAVTGFDASDLDFSASTVDLSAASVSVTPLDSLIANPLGWEVVVSGVLGGGTLSFDIPAGSVNAVADNAANDAASGSSAQVLFISGIAALDFNTYEADPALLGSSLRVGPQRATSTTTIEEDVWLDLDLNTPIFPDVGIPQVYGGLRAKAVSGTNAPGSTIIPAIMIANSEGETSKWPNDTFLCFATSGKNAANVGIDIDAWNVYLWKKTDFSGIDPAQPLAFNAGSRLAVGIDQWNGSNRRFHFIIKDGGNYYISEQSYAGDVEFSLNDFVNNALNRWAQIAFTEGTNDFSVALDDIASLSFAARSFNDVQAVGFAGRVTSAYYRFRAFETFTLDLVVDVDPYLATELTPSLEYVTGDKVALSVSAIDADSASLTYTWSILSQPYNADPSFSNGSSFALAAGETAENVVTFDKSGDYVFEVAISDGNTVIDSNQVTVTVQGSFAKDLIVPTITTTSIPDANEGQAYSTTLQATGGDGALTWSLSGAPAWLSVNPSTGELSGTPLAAGTIGFDAVVVDQDNDADARFLTLGVIAAPTQNPLTGTLDREYWTGISGTSISNLTSNANYPDSPTGADTLSSFQAVSWNDSSVTLNWADNYGQRIRGYIVPEFSANYTFWISGDDQCQLFLSSDASPANAVLIAQVTGWTRQYEWSKYTSQKSAEIYLEADQVYYVESLHKEGGGGDSLAVAWTQSPTVAPTASDVLSGSVLSAYSAGVPSVTSDPVVIVESDFTGTDLAYNTPWAATTQLHPGVSFSGWTLGTGLVPFAATDAFAYEQHMPSNEVDSTLAVSVADNEYISATIDAPSGTLNLRDAEMVFGIHRLTWHAARNYAIFTSIDGFAVGSEIADTGRFTDTIEVVFAFNFPDDPAYDNISGPVEIRIVGYGGQYYSKETSLTEFSITAVPPSPAP